MLSRPRPSNDEEDATNTTTQPGKMPNEHKQKTNAGIKHTQMHSLYSYSGSKHTHSSNLHVHYNSFNINIKFAEME